MLVEMFAIPWAAVPQRKEVFENRAFFVIFLGEDGAAAIFIQHFNLCGVRICGLDFSQGPCAIHFTVLLSAIAHVAICCAVENLFVSHDVALGSGRRGGLVVTVFAILQGCGLDGSFEKRARAW